MNRIVLSVCMIAVMSSLSFAGGGMKDVKLAVEPVIMVPVEVDESSFYVGIGLAAVSTRDTDVSLDFFNVKEGQDRLGNVSFLSGYNYNQYIAVEGRYNTTFTDEDLVEMSGWSLFVKPQYSVTEDFSVYALLGFGGVTLDAVNASTVDVDDSGFQWGIGVSYMAMESVSLFVDYTSLANEMDGLYYNGALQVDADAVTVGVNYQF